MIYSLITHSSESSGDVLEKVIAYTVYAMSFIEATNVILIVGFILVLFGIEEWCNHPGTHLRIYDMDSRLERIEKTLNAIEKNTRKDAEL